MPPERDEDLYQLIVIGEAAKNLSTELQERHPDIPCWSDICRARDLFVHHYRKVDSKELWETVVRDLPLLLHTLEDRSPSPG